MSTYDALIVGAGPAGAGAAALLAEGGARVLLLEKERFPRYKACGGGLDGLAARALESMGIDLEAVQEDAPTELRITKGGCHPATYRFDKPLAITTMRSELDRLIAHAAAARGAEFHDGERVRSVSDDGLGITVATDRGSYRGRVLIGADGAYSLTARLFQLNRNPVRYVLTSAEIAPPTQVQESWVGRAQIDISVWPLGYGWVFPKRDHLSIGIGVPLRMAKRLRQYYDQFRRHTGLAEAKVLLQRSHMLAFRWKQAPLATGRVLLVGDAAGLVDPNTGGGIAWGLRSAQYAASSVLGYLGGEASDLSGYSRLIDQGVEPEFRAARILRNGIVLRFILTRGRATRHKRLWSEVVRVIQGDEQYREWFRRARLARLLTFTAAIPL